MRVGTGMCAGGGCNTRKCRIHSRRSALDDWGLKPLKRRVQGVASALRVGAVDADVGEDGVGGGRLGE